VNNLARIPLYYEGSDRAEVIWLDDEVDEFCATAYPALARAVRMAAETALRPGDLVRLNRNHIRQTPEGERAILMRTNKSGRSTTVQIPVTPGAAAIIDATPPEQFLILTQHGALDRGLPVAGGCRPPERARAQARARRAPARD
jgi:integrase